MLAPRPAQAQAGTQRVNVCAQVACSASGLHATAFAEPARARARARPATLPSAVLPFAVPPSAAADRSAPAVATRDPWARRFQGRATDDDDACLLNIGLNGELARGGTLATHVLGRTQAWRGDTPASTAQAATASSSSFRPFMPDGT